MKIIEKLAARQRDSMANRPVCVACLGDSVTHGCFEVFIDERGNVDTLCRAHEAYPALVGRALGAMFPFAQPAIINAGASGDNAHNGLKRLDRDVLSFKPDLVTVNFGLNDAMNPDVEGGLRAYEASMRSIFERVLVSGAECLLVTPNFMCSYVCHALAQPRLQDIAKDAAHVQVSGVLKRYVDAARAAALDMGVRVADAYAAWESRARAGVNTTLMLSNYINHPTAEAQSIFVDEILGALLHG